MFIQSSIARYEQLDELMDTLRSDGFECCVIDVDHDFFEGLIRVWLYASKSLSNWRIIVCRSGFIQRFHFSFYANRNNRGVNPLLHVWNRASLRLIK